MHHVSVDSLTLVTSFAEDASAQSACSLHECVQGFVESAGARTQHYKNAEATWRWKAK